MKKSILLISLLTVSMAIFAIDYPTYKPIRHTYGGGVNGTNNTENTGTLYGGYSTTTSGGVTTDGEGSAIGTRGPRRAAWNGEGTPGINDTYVDENGKTWYWDGTNWSDTPSSNQGSADSDSRMPVGSPLLPMTLMALAMAGAVALRRRQAQA